MSKKTGKSNQLYSRDFRIKKLSVHFLYSFLLSSFDIGRHIETVGRERQFKSSVVECLQPRTWKNVSVEVFGAGRKGADWELRSQYLEPYLSLKMPRIEIHMRHPRRKTMQLLKWQEQRKKYVEIPSKVQLSGNIILLESGQGVVHYVLACEHESDVFDKAAVVNICNLGMRKKHLADKDKSNREFSKYKIAGSRGRELFLFSLFYDDFSNLAKALKEEFGEQDIRWLVADAGVALVPDISEADNKLHYQDPFPIVVFEVPDETYRMCFLDTDEPTFRKIQRACHDDLLTILFRSKALDFPDTSFAARFGYYSDGRLVNMCSTSAVFLHLYSRTAIAAYGRRREMREHADYIIPAFVETIKFLRMRWHTYVVATQWLDAIIKTLSQRPPAFKEVLMKIIDSEREIASALSDPISYRLGSGSMSKIYELGLDILRIHDLEEIFNVKSKMTSRLYQNLFQRKRIADLEEVSGRLLEQYEKHRENE